MTQIQSSYGFGYGAHAEQKVVNFTGGAGAGAVGTVGIFTVTGAVMIWMVCICTDGLVDGVGGSIVKTGIPTQTDYFIIETLAVLITSGVVWLDDAPFEYNTVPNMEQLGAKILANEQDIIATITVQPVTDGTLVFTAFWTPLTPGASVVAT